MDYLQTINNLTAILLAEKEEKRQLYNRFKQLERQRDDIAQMAALASDYKAKLHAVEEENTKLDEMLAKALDTQADITA